MSKCEIRSVCYDGYVGDYQVTYSSGTKIFYMPRDLPQTVKKFMCDSNKEKLGHVCVLWTREEKKG